MDDAVADALRLSMTILVEAAYRDGLARLDGTRLTIGDPSGPRVVATGCEALPFARLRVAGPIVAGDVPLGSAEAFLAALDDALTAQLKPRQRDRLRELFTDSLANLTQNLLLAGGPAAQEPAEGHATGHNVYPFRAYRPGLDCAELESWSNFRAPAQLALFRFAEVRQYGEGPAADDLIARAVGGGPAVLPVHPWHLRRSPVVRAAIADGRLRPLGRSVPVTPLLSLRTVRCGPAGPHVKLPLDMRTTSQRRLLPAHRVRNAPGISALVRAVMAESPGGPADIQDDVASLAHPHDDAVAAHLGAIFRRPVDRPGHVVLAATDLWTAEAAGPLRVCDLALTGPALADCCVAYLTQALQLPLLLYVRYGLLHCSHLQNCVVLLRPSAPGLPALVFRDLDALRVSGPQAAEARRLVDGIGASVGPDFWDQNPEVNLDRRFANILMDVHVGEVVKRCLAAGMPMRQARDCVRTAWRTATASLTEPAERRRLLRIYRAVGGTLRYPQSVPAARVQDILTGL